jgi:hypothetical protein
MTEFPKLLREVEVARILGCFPSKVARLRKARKLPYVPGRPILFDEADVLAYVLKYIESKKVAAAEHEPKQ